MRQIVQAAICVMFVWFGMFDLGGWAVYKGEAAREAEAVPASMHSASVSYYEAQPLLTEPVSYESGKELEREKPVVKAAALPNDRAEALSQESNQKVVYLTFDDGPSKNTEHVLSLLKKEGIKATFFVLGEHVLEQPKIAKRIAREGHSIGNHTFNHKYERLYGSFTEFADQVMKTDEAIYRTTGVRTTLFRAPGGTHSNFDQGYFDAMAAAGYQVHDWNVDSGDSKRRGVPASEIIATVKGSKLADKLIVLLHDSAGHEESVKALPAIIKYYKSKGYSFAPLTDKVEPIQFTVAKKLKWSREKVTESQRAKLAHFSEALGRSSRQAQAEQKEPVLILHRGEERLELQPAEYGVSKGAIEVSLLKLTEWIGGTAETDLDNGVIEAYMNGNRLLWLTGLADRPSNQPAGQIVVPVRETLKKFGIGITSFVYNDEQREIWITE
ncbi:polysaccharide deacetylase family protein [Paenibacillus prosopidis]|nr:polysaccharide deacetylase family protein [Paenibacillus prosopidis]